MMTDKQKLEVLVRKAVEGGYCLWEIGRDWTTENEITFHMRYINEQDGGVFGLSAACYAILFDHDFARALFGTEPCGEGLVEMDDRMYDKPLFQYHLQQAVIAPNPIDYLYKAVFKESHD